MMHNKINCLIVDDELSSQKVLEHFVKDTEVLDLKAICNNTSEAFKYLQLHNNIDLILLDINMPKQSGLDFYANLKHPPMAIFTTAYPQYAVEGFEVNAVDYLLKPISYERFLTAINKVLQLKDKQSPSDNFIMLKENKALHKVYFKDILFLEAYGDYVKVVQKDKTIVTHSTFKNLIESLPDGFLRIHKSFSINLAHMSLLSGNQISIDEYNLPIGQTYKQKVLNALKY